MSIIPKNVRSVRAINRQRFGVSNISLNQSGFDGFSWQIIETKAQLDAQYNALKIQHRGQDQK